MPSARGVATLLDSAFLENMRRDVRRRGLRPATMLGRKPSADLPCSEKFSERPLPGRRSDPQNNAVQPIRPLAGQRSSAG